MSPKEQATAARLLADWLAVWKRLREASELGDVTKMFSLLHELEGLGQRTDDFVGHEESN